MSMQRRIAASSRNAGAAHGAGRAAALGALLLVGAACNERAPASAPANPASSATATLPADAAQSAPAGAAASSGPSDATRACVDRELRARHLNEFGDPEGTMYAGGTPLFDEAGAGKPEGAGGGRTRDRMERIVARHSDIAAKCGLGSARGPGAPRGEGGGSAPGR
jgi:hypothetical protein